MTSFIKQLFVIIVVCSVGIWFFNGYVFSIWKEIRLSSSEQIDDWLKENQLEKYWELFHQKGKN